MLNHPFSCGNVISEHLKQSLVVKCPIPRISSVITSPKSSAPCHSISHILCNSSFIHDSGTFKYLYMNLDCCLIFHHCGHQSFNSGNTSSESLCAKQNESHYLLFSEDEKIVILCSPPRILGSLKIANRC